MSALRGGTTIKLRCVLLLLTAVSAASCTKVSLINEKAYVVPERLKLKSSTAPASRVIGELKTGDEVTVTDRANAEDGRNWSRVNGPNGEAGWAETSSLVREEIVDRSRKIAEEIKDIPTQAVGKSKAQLKLRLTADRSSDDNVATMLPSGSTLEIVARERKPRPANVQGNAQAAPEAKDAKDIKYDEWLKVRLKELSVLPAGWIYGGSIEIDIPGEIVYFASTGKKIVGWQKIATIKGNDSRTGEHYLVVERKLTDADDRADFDRIKILAYDPATRNYVTPFRDDVLGRFPVILNMQGTRGAFRFRGLDKAGQLQPQEFALEMLEGGRIKVPKPKK